MITFREMKHRVALLVFKYIFFDLKFKGINNFFNRIDGTTQMYTLACIVAFKM